MKGLHPLEPSKEDLLYVFEQALMLLPLTKKDIEQLHTAFEISFEGHRLAPRRESGEIYFMHVFRQFICAVLLMKKYRVVSVTLLILILLHDTVEDAVEGQSTIFLAKSQIHLRFNNDRIVYSVMSTTKRKKEGETRVQFLLRIIHSDIWEVLVAKPFDGKDNTGTLYAMPKEKQPGKVQEIFDFYPLIEARAIHLITMAGKKGELTNYRRWIRLVQETHRALRYSAFKEKRRIKKEGIDKVA
jgi:hypothetical protein